MLVNLILLLTCILQDEKTSIKVLILYFRKMEMYNFPSILYLHTNNNLETLYQGINFKEWPY